MPTGDDSGDVVQLHTRRGFRPDMAGLARGQVAGARKRLGLSTSEFAEVLRPVLGWTPSPEVLESWESSVVPPGDVVIAAGVVSQAAAHGSGDFASSDLVAQLIGRRFADVDSVFPTRSEFTSRLPPHELFDKAHDVRAAGLSLNLLCQQYADEQLRQLVERGALFRCLFLDPDGDAIKEREREEDYAAGYLSALTDLNIQILVQRVRQRLPDDARDRLQIATYDEIPRFNLVIVDDQLAVVQPYLPAARGVESPTFVLRRQSSLVGLFSTFGKVFDWLWARSTPK